MCHGANTVSPADSLRLCNLETLGKSAVTFSLTPGSCRALAQPLPCLARIATDILERLFEAVELVQEIGHLRFEFVRPIT